ncbi:hypothetical protein AKJ16_DCAP15295 [Drosera capensis]
MERDKIPPVKLFTAHTDTTTGGGGDYLDGDSGGSRSTVPAIAAVSDRNWGAQRWGASNKSS